MVIGRWLTTAQQIFRAFYAGLSSISLILVKKRQMPPERNYTGVCVDIIYPGFMMCDVNKTGLFKRWHNK